MLDCNFRYSQLSDLQHVERLTLHLYGGDNDFRGVGSVLGHLEDMPALVHVAVRWENDLCPKQGKEGFDRVYTHLQRVVEKINDTREAEKRDVLQVDYLVHHVPWWKVAKQHRGDGGLGGHT